MAALLKSQLVRLAIEAAQRQFGEILGIRRGFMLTYRMPADILRYGERWRPFRSVASWYLWRSIDLHRKQAIVLPE